MEQGIDLSVMASTSASHNSVVMIPSKFHPHVSFASEALIWIKERKTFIQARSGVRHTAGYITMLVLTLHFVTYIICMKAEREGKHKASTKRKPAFISKCFLQIGKTLQ